MRLRLGMLASHGGTNVQAVVKACEESRLAAEPALIISNNRDSAVLEFGRSRRIPSVWIGGGAYEDQALRDQAICTQLLNHNVEIVLLLGYMRKLGPATLGSFRSRILNIHPSLLPAFPGLHAQQQALDHGVKVSGCTVHFVDEGLDSGPIICQAVVPVISKDTVETLSARILKKEHQIYSEAIALVLDGRYRIEGRRVLS